MSRPGRGSTTHEPCGPLEVMLGEGLLKHCDGGGSRLRLEVGKTLMLQAPWPKLACCVTWRGRILAPLCVRARWGRVLLLMKMHTESTNMSYGSGYILC